MTIPNISPERRIAISFVKILRRYFDQNMRPLSAEESDVQIEVTPSVGGDKSPPVDIPEEVLEAMREVFDKAQQEVYTMLKPRYELVLIKIIGEALGEIEDTLRSKFTKEELDDLAGFIEKDSVKKMLGCFELIDNLQKHSQNLYADLQSQFQDICVNSDLNDRMADNISSLLKKYGLDGTFKISHDNMNTDEDNYEDDSDFEDDKENPNHPED